MNTKIKNMNTKIKNNSTLLKEIIWYDINADGLIDIPLKHEAGIYVYTGKYSAPEEKISYYVGSTSKLKTRINSHRKHVANFNKYKNKGSPLFYRSVIKYGWLSFKFGILEYINVPNNIETSEKRKIILAREQYYLDEINPSLNICNTAGSPLGIKRDINFSINLSNSLRRLERKK